MQSMRKKSFAAEQLALRQQKKVSPVVWVLVDVVVVALVVGGYVMYRRSVEQADSEVQKIKSIAVLPFRDMSPDKDQDHLCEGIAEDIINALTYIKELKTLASTSSFAFKGKQMVIREIGKELGVDAVFEGSISKYGSKIRITAQLINVADGFHIISDKYDYETEDMFSIRDDISMKIVKALRVELGQEEKAAIEKRYTENSEAYNSYFLGRYHLKYLSEEEVNKAISYFMRATEIDPFYALAYAGIAESYNWLGTSHYLPPKESSIEVKKWVKKALDIDEKIAEAYISLATANIWYDWDWDAAKKNYELAIEINPSNADVYFWYTDYYCAIGQYANAGLKVRRVAVE